MKRYIALALVVAAASSASMALAAERGYTDDPGDSGTAPDLTSVTVTDSNGFLAFKITGTLVPSSSFVIYVDTDRNQSTGDDGDELMLGVDQETDGKTYWFASRWSGSKWERAGIDVSSQTFTGRQELGFRASDAGITGAFDFVVLSYKMVADAVEGRDRAPDSVVPWTYELATQAAAVSSARTVLGQVRVTPSPAAAGKPLTVRVPVRRSDNGVIATRPATCTALVKGRTLRGRGSVIGGLATCKLAVPRGMSHATGRGSITVGAGADAVTKAFSFRVA